MSNEKYLVTGAGGFIGANLISKLSLEGRHTVAAVHSDHNWRIEDNNNVEVVKIDITDSEELKEKLRKINPTHVINLATYGVYRDQKTPELIYEVNVNGTKNLLASILELPNIEKFISTGSVFEYGSLPGRVSEDQFGEIRNEYDRSKQTVNQLIKDFSIKHQLPVVTLRLFTAYGPMEDKRRLVASSVIKAIKGQEIVISDAIRDFIHVSDIADAYLSVLDGDNKFGETYNIGSGVASTVKDVVERICSVVGSEINVLVTDDFLLANDSKCHAAITKIEKDFGWKPKTDLDQGLQQTIDWYKTNLTKYKKYYE